MMNASVSGSVADLVELGPLLWQELVRASQEPRHEWRQATLATVCAVDGPQARTVVLREVEERTRTLLVYTDTRSPKVAQLRADPRAQLVCWSRALGWQLRLRCRVEVRADGLDVSSRWARLRHTPSAQDYLSPQAPGTPLWLAAPAEPAGAMSAGEVRAHFAVMRLQVLEMDWLELAAGGHRRAVFDCRDAEMAARWCVP